MLFNSYTFAGFFVAVLALHALPLPWSVRKLVLVVASYGFYAAWEPPYVVLLWVSTGVDWYAARWIARASTPAWRRAALGFSLVANLGLLGAFKYGGFIEANLRAAWGLGPVSAAAGWVLPVGISFYTFQTLSYTIDVYRGRLAPAARFLDYALFVAFFPQLVAGPIVRAAEFLPQLARSRRATGQQLAWGLNLLLIGLFQKVVLADRFLAPTAERVYGAAGPVDVLSAYLGTFAFTGQVYCDFAGYSSCALGAAHCLGFTLPANFRAPFAAVGFGDFWRRWHISLSSWLRDYLYVSLGGNRGGAARTALNLFLTLLASGVWHGAAWTLIVWGGLHGVILAAERTLSRTRLGAWWVWRTAVGRAGLCLLTVYLFALTLAVFRARDLRQAAALIRGMLGGGEGGARCVEAYDAVAVGLAFGGTVALHWFAPAGSLERLASRCPTGLWTALLAAMLVALIISPGGQQAYVYYQF